MMDKLFYMQDSRSLTGDNVMFWRKGGNGYGTNLDELETYTLQEAQRQHNGRESDVPLLKSLVDEASIVAVDCQVLPDESREDPSGEFVVQRKGYWNGNDILFAARGFETYEYTKAGVFKLSEVDSFFNESDDYAVFSKQDIDKLCRRTFQGRNINKRSMISSAGIKLIKPKRVRPTTGKERHNCPVCGRIVWDFNPYEAPACSRDCQWELDHGR
jgi:hypothetical protein